MTVTQGTANPFTTLTSEQEEARIRAFEFWLEATGRADFFYQSAERELLKTICRPGESRERRYVEVAFWTLEAFDTYSGDAADIVGDYLRSREEFAKHPALPLEETP